MRFVFGGEPIKEAVPLKRGLQPGLSVSFSVSPVAPLQTDRLCFYHPSSSLAPVIHLQQHQLASVVALLLSTTACSRSLAYQVLRLCAH